MNLSQTFINSPTSFICKYCMYMYMCRKNPSCQSCCQPNIGYISSSLWIWINTEIFGRPYIVRIYMHVLRIDKFVCFFYCTRLICRSCELNQCCVICTYQTLTQPPTSKILRKCYNMSASDVWHIWCTEVQGLCAKHPKHTCYSLHLSCCHSDWQKSTRIYVHTIGFFFLLLLSVLALALFFLCSAKFYDN